MMARLALLALVLLACACNQTARTVAVKDEALFMPTQEAIAVWDIALAHSRCPQVSLNPVEDPAYADITIELGKPTPGKYASEHSGRIIVAPWRIEEQPEVLVLALAHELGHSMLDHDNGHSDDKRDLMYPGIARTLPEGAPEGAIIDPNPTAADVAWICDHNTGLF